MIYVLRFTFSVRVSKDWKGEKEDEYKWLLDQASLVEIWATIAKIG
jgi:hypothetical protein